MNQISQAALDLNRKNHFCVTTNTDNNGSGTYSS